MKTKELKATREKDVKALEVQVAELRKKIRVLAPKTLAGREKNTSQLKVMKRDIAQILGIMREKQL